MFTFQSIMFVSLGFLCALLLGFVVAPAFWARAVRLTTERIRAALPLTEQEISAERDRLRAENAIRVHQLSAKIERARLYDARQKVEINRRDGTISELQRRLQAIETEREGSENARRVLEATIKQRVPEVEARLMEARQLLAKRDSEMKSLQTDTSKTFRALDDAMQVNAQQRAEIDRLKMSLAGHGARTHSPASGSETETALRAELENLRQRARDQAALIDKLQNVARSAGDGPGPAEQMNNGAAADGRVGGQVGLGARLEQADAGRGDTQRKEIEALQAKLAQQAATIAKLTGQLADKEGAAPDGGRSVSPRDSKSSSKAGVAASEKLLAARDQTIATLRRELATANERLAKQASHYQNELRRLGTRNSAGSGKPGAGDTPPAVPALSTSGASPVTIGDGPEGPQGEGIVASDAVLDRGTDVNGTRGAPGSLDARLAAVAVDAATDPLAIANSQRDPAAGDDETRLDFDDHVEVGKSTDKPGKPEPRGRLMDRIAGLAKR